MSVSYARILENVVQEVWYDGGLGVTPSDVFFGDFGGNFIECPEHVLPGWLYENGEFSEPVIVENVEED